MSPVHYTFSAFAFTGIECFGHLDKLASLDLSYITVTRDLLLTLAHTQKFVGLKYAFIDESERYSSRLRQRMHSQKPNLHVMLDCEENFPME